MGKAKATLDAVGSIADALGGTFKAAAPLTAAAALGYSEDSEAGFAGTLARTADEFMLSIAQKMKSEGLPREDIWQKTGWFEGVDGKWRFEIDDSASKTFPFSDPQTERLYPDGFITGDTSDFLLHKELGEAYPDAMRIDTMVEGDKTGKLAGTASYTPADPGDADTFGSPEMIRVGPRNGGIDKSAYLHEVQHGIQHREGFAKGGSPYEFLEDLKASKNIYEGEIGALNAQMTDIVRRKDAAIKAGDSALVDSLSKDYEAAMSARSDLVGKMQAQGLGDSIGMMDAANNQYKRLAGEVEARNVQTRLDMSPAERRATPPWTTEDIPESEQIVRMRGAATPEAMAAAAIPGAVGAYANKRAEQKQTLAQTYAKTNPVNLMAAALLSRVDWSHLDDPARGVYGLVASVKSLFEGQGLSEALQQGGRIASQPVEQTAQQVGDAVYEATDSPLAATAALTATNVWGPM